MAVDIKRASADSHTPPPPLAGTSSALPTGNTGSGGHNMVLSFILMVLAAVVAGGSVYFGLKSSYDADTKKLKEQISSLQRQLADASVAQTPATQTTPTPTSSPSASPSPATANEFDVTKAKVGDKVAGMTIKAIVPYSTAKGKIAVDNAKVTFTEETTVSGKYTYHDEGILDGKVCIDELDSASIAKLPIIVGDERDKVWFCLSNTSAYGTLFGTKGSTGNATIAIKGYIINAYPSEVTNTAEFVKLVSKK